MKSKRSSSQYVSCFYRLHRVSKFLSKEWVNVAENQKSADDPNQYSFNVDLKFIVDMKATCPPSAMLMYLP